MWCYKHSQREITDKNLYPTLSSSTGTFNIWEKKLYMNSSLFSFIREKCYHCLLHDSMLDTQMSSFHFIRWRKLPYVSCWLLLYTCFFITGTSDWKITSFLGYSIYWQVDNVNPLGLTSKCSVSLNKWLALADALNSGSFEVICRHFPRSF